MKALVTHLIILFLFFCIKISHTAGIQNMGHDNHLFIRPHLLIQRTKLRAVSLNESGENFSINIIFFLSQKKDLPDACLSLKRHGFQASYQENLRIYLILKKSFSVLEEILLCSKLISFCFVYKSKILCQVLSRNPFSYH